MGHILIKPVPDRDEYVYWSTVVEAPIAFGSRVEMLAEFAEEWKRDHGDIPPQGWRSPEARLARADEYGSSAVDGFFRWDETTLIFEQRGLLARKDLYRAAELLHEEREAEVWDLLTPFEDEVEVRRG
ncbi:hypothetical protein K1W54_29745 [Micromonospora sp. CPCC 205371]|nr:hypothetical protein [Micromonospora sp. CPCC 205371]